MLTVPISGDVRTWFHSLVGFAVRARFHTAQNFLYSSTWLDWLSQPVSSTKGGCKLGHFGNNDVTRISRNCLLRSLPSSWMKRVSLERKFLQHFVSTKEDLDSLFLFQRKCTFNVRTYSLFIYTSKWLPNIFLLFFIQTKIKKFWINPTYFFSPLTHPTTNCKGQRRIGN